MRRANEIEQIERSFPRRLPMTNHDPTRPDLPEAAGRRSYAASGIDHPAYGGRQHHYATLGFQCLI